MYNGGGRKQNELGELTCGNISKEMQVLLLGNRYKHGKMPPLHVDAR